MRVCAPPVFCPSGASSFLARWPSPTQSPTDPIPAGIGSVDDGVGGACIGSVGDVVGEGGCGKGAWFKHMALT